MFIFSIRVHRKQALFMEFQIGFLMSNSSLKKSYGELKLHYNIQCIIIFSHNQDALENFKFPETHEWMQ